MSQLVDVEGEREREKVDGINERERRQLFLREYKNINLKAQRVRDIPHVYDDVGDCDYL